MNHLTNIPSRRGRGKNKAFTLLELLAVMAVTSVIMTLTTVGMGNVVRNFKITQGSSLIIDTLVLARQTAVTKNLSVEVRFYKMTDGQGERFKAIRLIGIDNEGNEKPLNRLEIFPKDLELTETKQYSSLLDQTSVPRSGIETLASGESLSYLGFRIKPSGLTDLQPDGQWFLTVQPFNRNGELGPNFSTVQINPVTGVATIYRP